MTNTINIATEGVPVTSPQISGLLDLMFSSGPIGLLAWSGILIVIIAAITTIVRHSACPKSHKHGTHFFQIAHVVFFIFINHVGVGSMFGICCGPISYWTSKAILSVSIGLSVLLACSLLVSIVLKKLPKPSLWSLFGCAAAIASFAIIMIGFTLICGPDY